MTPQTFRGLQHREDMPLRNARHEAFAQRVVTGECFSTAYRHVYRGNAKSAGANGAGLIKNDSVAERIRWLQAQSAQGAVMSVVHRRKFLARVVRTPISQVEENSELCQSFKQTKRSYRKAMPDKLQAIALDSRLAGDLPLIRQKTGSGNPLRQDPSQSRSERSAQNP